MGVKGLLKHIRLHAPNSITKSNDINELVGQSKVVAIDAMIYIHRWISTDVRYKGRLVNHIQGITYMTLALIEKRIIPLWVFDGPVHRMKRVTVNKRKDRGYKVKISSITDVVKECIDVLTVLHVPYIMCTGDAEACAANLVKSGKAYAVMTYDSDALMFGATRVIMGSYTSSNVNQSSMMMIKLNVVLKELGMTMKQFVTFCIDLGTDYRHVDGGKVTYNDIKDIANVDQINSSESDTIRLDLVTLDDRQRTATLRKLDKIMISIGMSETKRNNILQRVDKIIVPSV